MTQARASAPAAIRRVQASKGGVAYATPDQAGRKAASDHLTPRYAGDAKGDRKKIGQAQGNDIDRAEDAECPTERHSRERRRRRKEKRTHGPDAHAKDTHSTQQCWSSRSVARDEVTGDQSCHPSRRSADDLKHARASMQGRRKPRPRECRRSSTYASRSDAGRPRRDISILLLACALAFSSPTLGRAAAAPAPSATPFESPVASLSRAGDALARARSVSCLAAAVYYEAGNQSLLGREAVAQVVLNRVHHRAYPKSVCGVVYQGAPSPGCQFSFACDGSLARRPNLLGWGEAEEIAKRAIDGELEPTIGLATHYHATYVHPAWSDRLTRVSQIGAHLFYTLPGKSPASLPGDSDLAGAFLYGATAATPLRRMPDARGPHRADFNVWGLTVATAASHRDGGISVLAGPGT